MNSSFSFTAEPAEPSLLSPASLFPLPLPRSRSGPPGGQTDLSAPLATLLSSGRDGKSPQRGIPGVGEGLMDGLPFPPLHSLYVCLEETRHSIKRDPRMLSLVQLKEKWKISNFLGLFTIRDFLCSLCGKIMSCCDFQKLGFVDAICRKGFPEVVS